MTRSLFVGYTIGMSSSFEWYGDKYIKKVNTATIVSLTRSINIVDTDAKLNVPVDTGILRGSLESDVDYSSLIATESTNVEYSPNVEFGTIRQKAQPYLRPALADNTRKIKEIFSKEVGKAVGK